MAPLEGSAGSEAPLAERLQAGEPAAARELVVRFQRGVAVILRRSGAQASEVEDLAQEVFRIVLDKVRQGEVREPERLPGYVATVARNLGIEAGRRASAQAARDGGELAEDVAAGTSTALERLVDEEQAQLVRRVLDDLGTSRDRDVLFRIYLSGDDRDEVGRSLGLSPLQLNRVLYRARERYRVLYEQALQREHPRSRA